MTAQEAIKLLHPDTTKEAIAEIKYYCGFHGKEAAVKAIEDACLLACDALERNRLYCKKCGQAIEAWNRRADNG